MYTNPDLLSKLKKQVNTPTSPELDVAQGGRVQVTELQAVEVILAILENHHKTTNERMKEACQLLGSKESFILWSVELKNQINAQRALGFVKNKDNLSEELSDRLKEKCAITHNISSKLEFSSQHEENEFWQRVRDKIELCLTHIYL